jgi:hypothetical protein
LNWLITLPETLAEPMKTLTELIQSGQSCTALEDLLLNYMLFVNLDFAALLGAMHRLCKMGLSSFGLEYFKPVRGI